MYPKSFVRSLGRMAWDFSTDAEFAEHLDWFGQVKLGLMHEVLGASPLAPFAWLLEAVTSSD